MPRNALISFHRTSSIFRSSSPFGALRSIVASGWRSGVSLGFALAFIALNDGSCGDTLQLVGSKRWTLALASQSTLLRPSLNAITHLDPVVEASLYIQDALTYSTHTHPRPGELARFLHLVQLYMQPLVKWALMALVLATFFELPAWCATDSDCKASLQGGRLTGAYYSGYPMIYTNDTDPIIFGDINDGDQLGRGRSGCSSSALLFG